MTNEETFKLIEVAGQRKWLCSNGRLLPYVAGGSGDGGGGDGGQGGQGGQGSGSGVGTPPEKKFTQEDVNALVGDARTKARDKAIKDFAATMGIDDPEQIKALVQAAKDAEAANATELDKERKAREKAENDHKKSSGDLGEFKLTTAIEKALVKAGLTMDAAEKARPLVTVNEEDEAKITAAIEDLKKTFPALFTPSGSNPGTGTPPGSNPGAPPAGGGGKPNDPAAQAKVTLYERHPELKKS